MAYLLDACALIALLADEEGAAAVGSIVESSECHVHSINVYELYKDCLARSGSTTDADELLSDLGTLGLRRVDCMRDDELKRAAVLKVGHKMAIPDAIGVATAEIRTLTFLTADHGELDAVKAAGSPIEFFR
jgi:PIN domain nuclease of toxin-antitoxin system